MAKNSAKSKGYRRQNTKKPYLSKRDIGILCVVLVALVVGAFFLFSYDDGALKVQDGAVVTGGDNWIVADGSNVRGRSRYFKVGEMGEIDGFSREKTALSSDANVPQYVFTPDDGDTSSKISVSASHGSAEVLAKYIMSNISVQGDNTLSELMSAELAGHKVQYCIYSIVPPDEAADAADGEATEAEVPADDADTDSAEAPADDADGQVADDAAEVPADDTDGDSAEAPADDAAADGPVADDADAADDSAGAVPGFARTLVAYADATHDCSVAFQLESLADSADALMTEDALTALLEQALSAVTFEEGK